MRIRRKKWAKEELDSASFFVKRNGLREKLLEKLLQNKFEEIHMELGAGKGEFISKLAPNNQDILYIAVDMVEAMLGETAKKIKKEYEEKNIEPNNIILLEEDASHIVSVFLGQNFLEYLKSGEILRNNYEQLEQLKIDRIYINFCNPWPKRKHKKRRLTHPLQLLEYLKILKVGGEIFFKTDDFDLFKDSVLYFDNINKFSKMYKEQFEKYIEETRDDLYTKFKEDFLKKEVENIKIFNILEYTENLEKEDIFENKLKNVKENIETEHEREFKKQNKKIYALIVKKGN